MLPRITAHPVGFSILASILVVGAAFGFQLAGYPPCEMCWWQRYPYMAVAVIGLAAYALRQTHNRIVHALIAILFATTGGLGFFHWGVEFKWWDGPGTCTAGLDLSGDTAAALDAIMNAPLVRCDEVAWSLFGLSMAGYNMLIGFALAGFMVWTMTRKAD